MAMKIQKILKDQANPGTPYPTYEGVLDVEPQIVSDLGFITDSVNWVLISGCFIPQGGEAFITIGNFSSNEETPIDTNCMQNPAMEANSYYFIDDVSVIKSGLPENLEVDLGGPILACDSFEIDPGISNASYLWEDGSQNSTLVVTESGTYFVTITSACSMGVGFLDVEIHGLESVQIGPPEIEFCAGESYNISLDPELGNYQWQNGSTETEYSITTSGLYSVTLDDGCNKA